MRGHKGFTLLELLVVLAVLGIVVIGIIVGIYKVFIASSVKTASDAIKANVVYTVTVRCSDDKGRETASYTGLKDACKMGDGKLKLTTASDDARTIDALGCSVSCPGNAPADCGQSCR